MNHKQAYQDYLRLSEIAGGDPYDSSQTLEDIAHRILINPSARNATKELVTLIELFADRGGPNGDSLMDDPEAVEIFTRHGFAN